MKNKQFILLSVLLVLLMLLSACGTTEKTEYDLLELTEISGTVEQNLDTVLDDASIAELSAEQKERVDLLKSRKTKNEIRERILAEDDRIVETMYTVGIKDNEICVIYHLHVDGTREQPDGTVEEVGLMSVLVK